jgi:hypothetical protein
MKKVTLMVYSTGDEKQMQAVVVDGTRDELLESAVDILDEKLYAMLQLQQLVECTVVSPEQFCTDVMESNKE